MTAVAEPSGAERSRRLVERFQDGDPDAFEQIYRRYRPTVAEFLLFRSRDPQLAQDLTQEVFVRALRRLHLWEWQGRDLSAWLITIARNLLADHFKSHDRRRRGQVLDPDDHFARIPDQTRTGDVESLVVDGVFVEKSVLPLLAKLKVSHPKQYDTLVNRFFRGLSVTETAEAMGLNEGAVKALQYRATRAMARRMGVPQ